LALGEARFRPGGIYIRNKSWGYGPAGVCVPCAVGLLEEMKSGGGRK